MMSYCKIENYFSRCSIPSARPCDWLSFNKGARTLEPPHLQWASSYQSNFRFRPTLTYLNLAMMSRARFAMPLRLQWAVRTTLNSETLSQVKKELFLLGKVAKRAKGAILRRG